MRDQGPDEAQRRLDKNRRGASGKEPQSTQVLRFLVIEAAPAKNVVIFRTSYRSYSTGLTDTSDTIVTTIVHGLSRAECLD